MIALDPSYTANLAKEIYDLVDKRISQREAILSLKHNYSDVFELSPANIAHSRTGGPSFIKIETAFGLMAYGVGKSKKRGFYYIAWHQNSSRFVNRL